MIGQPLSLFFQENCSNRRLRAHLYRFLTIFYASTRFSFADSPDDCFDITLKLASL